MLDKERNIRDQSLRYNIIKWKNQGSFDSLKDISYYIKLLQLMHLIGNVNHAVSIVGKCIFDSNFKKDLPLLLEWLNLTYSSSDGEKIFTLFEKVFYSVRYINPKEKNKKRHKVKIPVYGGKQDKEINYIMMNNSTVNKLISLNTILQWISTKNP